MKNYLLYIAMFLMILSLPIRGNANEVRWIWADIPWIPVTLIFASLICIGLYLYKNNRELNNADK